MPNLLNLKYEELALLSTAHKCGPAPVKHMLLDSFLNSDKYAMKVVFDEDDMNTMKMWCESKEGRTPFDWYLAQYNSYQTIITRDLKYKSKMKVQRISHGKKLIDIYFVRKDKTLTIGDACQRRGYKE